MPLMFYKVLYGQEMKIKGKTIEKNESLKDTKNQFVKKCVSFFTGI